MFSVFSAMNFLAMRELGNCVHSSVKTYYFGVLSTFFAVTFISFKTPSFFKFWDIGQQDFPLSLDQFYGTLFIGFFSWTAQESLSLALTSVKSGVTAAFYNVALVISFIVDISYFHRVATASDITGTTLIILATTA